MKVPKNLLYLTAEDYEEYQNQMQRLINSEELMYLSPEAIDKGGMRTQTITFVLTEDCDLNCTYCYLTHKTKKRMTKEVAKQAIDFLFDEQLVNGYFDVNQKKSVILDFIGGEPLLAIDIMDFIVEYFKLKAFSLDHPWATDYHIHVTTNGVQYNSEKVQNFLKRNKGKISVGITVDGNKELHDSCRVFPDGTGSYDIVEKAIKTWVKQEDTPMTKITLCPDNVMYLYDAMINVWSLGVKAAFTNCVFEPGWEIQHAGVLYKEMVRLADYLLQDNNFSRYYCSLFDETIGMKLTDTKNWCGGNGDMLAIGTDGQCFSCIRFMKYSLTNPKSAEKPVGDIWKGLDAKNKNPWLLELCSVDMVTQCQNEDNKKCLDCPVSTGCSLCTGFNYDYFGTPKHRATFICDMHKARTLANAYYWNKLYKKLGINKVFKINLPIEESIRLIGEEEYNKLLNAKEV